MDCEKNGLFLLINKFLLFQYLKGIFCVSTRAVAFNVAQNDQMLTLLFTRIKFAFNSLQRLENKGKRKWLKGHKGSSWILRKKNGHFCSLTNFYCFNFQWGFSPFLPGLAQNDQVLTLLFTRTKFPFKSQQRLKNKDMNRNG